MIRCVIFSAFLLSIFTHRTNGYCWEPGKNPGFTGPPKVEQIDLQNVRVSWDGLVTQRDCADQFLVKYWQRSNPQDYSTSDLLDVNANSVVVKVIPKVDYQFQAVAREDKGVIGGIDWNKSPLTDFRTSVHNKEVPLKQEPAPTAATSTKSAAANPPNSNSPSQGTSQLTVPTAVSEVQPKESALPLSIEMLAVVVVCAVGVLLIFIGVVYKFFCNKSSEEVDEESYAEENEEKEHLDSTDS